MSVLFLQELAWFPLLPFQLSLLSSPHWHRGHDSEPTATDGTPDVLKQPLVLITKKSFLLPLHIYVHSTPAVVSSSDGLRPPLRSRSAELLHTAAEGHQKQWEKKKHQALLPCILEISQPWKQWCRTMQIKKFSRYNSVWKLWKQGFIFHTFCKNGILHWFT